MVHDFLPKAIGGTEIYTYSLSKELSKHHDIHLFFSDSKIDIREFMQRSSYDDLTFTAINPSRYTEHSTNLNLLKIGRCFICTNERVDEAFKTLIEEFKPDIIHFQHLIKLSTNLVNIAYKAKIPTVFTVHDYWLLCPKAHLIDNNQNICVTNNNRSKCIKCLWSDSLYKFKKIKISQPKTYIELPKNLIKIVLNFLALLHTIFHVFYVRPKAIREIVEKIDLFIVPSYLLQQKLIEYGVPQDKVVCMELGIADAIGEDIKRIESEQLRFAFIGPLVPHKGIRVLLEAFNNIDVENVTLDLYGPFWEGAKSKYMKLLRNDNIKFRGKFEHWRVREVFCNIDVLIVPSICMENSPLTIREAFATKTPVIASNIGGMPEIVQNGKTGLLFKVGDPQDLAEKLNYFIHNPSEVKKMSSEIGPVKTIEENAIEMETIYRGLNDNKMSHSGKQWRMQNLR